MPDYPKSLASVRDLTLKNFENIIAQAFLFKKNGFNTTPQKHVVILAFFEPSTRTRASFEIAAHRVGLKPVNFTGDDSTSIKKGESLHETFETLLAMGPDLFVCRHGGDATLAKHLAKCPCHT